MITPEKRLERVRAHRKYQPSAIGNSLFMLLVRYVSLAAFALLSASSIYIYASRGTLDESQKAFVVQCIRKVKEFVHLRSEDASDQAYLLMIIALMFLGVYKLTTMVLRRNDYIFTLNEVMDSEE